jgi:hypothetical protein
MYDIPKQCSNGGKTPQKDSRPFSHPLSTQFEKLLKTSRRSVWELKISLQLFCNFPFVFVITKKLSLF